MADLEFQSDFTLVSKAEVQLTALVGFFDVEFQSVPHQVSFSTSPSNIPTHWKQTVFLLQNPVSVVAGKLSRVIQNQQVNKDMFVMDDKV